MSNNPPPDVNYPTGQPAPAPPTGGGAGPLRIPSVSLSLTAAAAAVATAPSLPNNLSIRSSHHGHHGHQGHQGHQSHQGHHHTHPRGIVAAVSSCTPIAASSAATSVAASNLTIRCPSAPRLPPSSGVHLVPVSVPIPLLNSSSTSNATSSTTSTTFYKPVTITPAILNPPTGGGSPLRIPAPPKNHRNTTTNTSSVTIQKANTTNPKTISLPYNNHIISPPQVVQKNNNSSTIASPLPIARVVPQPTSSSSSGGGGGGGGNTLDSVTLISNTAMNLSTTPSATSDARQRKQPASSPARVVSIPPSVVAASNLVVQGPPSVSVTPVLAASAVKGVSHNSSNPVVTSIPSSITAILQSKDAPSILGSLVPANSNNKVLLNNSSATRPGILRRREGERGDLMVVTTANNHVGTIVGEHTTIIENNNTTTANAIINNREDESLSSGSTTLSATSSPGFGYHSGGEDHHQQNNNSSNTFNNAKNNSTSATNSPRKKPRKQNFNALIYNNEDDREEDDDDDYDHDGYSNPIHKRMNLKRKATHHHQQEQQKSSSNRRKRQQLLSSYHAPWKTCHNHFLRHSDVKTKDNESGSIRPTVHELISTHRYISQQINGWKIHHLSAQMEDVTLMEAELTERLSELQRRLEYSAHSEINLSKVQEMIKANLQRSKIVRDQVGESKSHLMNIFDHKPKIMDIISKYVSKRQVKAARREISNV